MFKWNPSDGIEDPSEMADDSSITETAI